MCSPMIYNFDMDLSDHLRSFYTDRSLVFVNAGAYLQIVIVWVFTESMQFCTLVFLASDQHTPPPALCHWGPTNQDLSRKGGVNSSLCRKESPEHFEQHSAVVRLCLLL